MTYRQKQQAMAYDYSNGMSIEEIALKYKYKLYIVERFVNAKKNKINVEHFNVHQYDCWIMPTKPFNESN
jgi:hypothetical protein